MFGGRLPNPAALSYCPTNYLQFHAHNSRENRSWLQGMSAAEKRKTVNLRGAFEQASDPALEGASTLFPFWETIIDLNRGGCRARPGWRRRCRPRSRGDRERWPSARGSGATWARRDERPR